MNQKFSLWEELAALTDVGETNLWSALARDLEARPARTGSLPLWMLPTYQPSGFWRELQEETILLRPIERDIWSRLTLQLIQRGYGSAENDLWDAVQEETILLRARRRDIWVEAAEETLLIAPIKTNLWQELKPGDLTRYYPQRKTTWALKQLNDKDGVYYILKHTQNANYLRLSPEQRFLWDLLDGKNNIQDIVIAYLIEYQTFDIEGLMALLTQLEKNGFIQNPRAKLFESAQNASQHATLLQKFTGLLQIEFSLNNLDVSITRLYRWVGGILYHRFTQILMAIVTLSGLAAFTLYNLNTPRPTNTQLPLLSLLSFYIVLALVFLIHELAHALTVKHFQREVRRGGVMLYMGFPAFFVDTTDIWLSPRRARLLVSWAGPYSGFVLAGTCALLLFVIPHPAIQTVLFQSAFSAYSLSLFQLNPLLHYDGYFILMDWLEIPRLRERSIAFVQTQFWSKLRQRQTFTRQERLFAIFGVLSVVWTIVTLGLFAVTGAGWLLAGLHLLSGN
ncbi:MAG: hypothetical protein OHK0052_15180 [Anaerolineales bacterium]